MRIAAALTVCAGLGLLFAQMALAQADFPAVKVAQQVGDSVVSIDIHSVAFASLSGGGGGEFARTGALATRRMTGFVYTDDGYIVTDSQGISETAFIKVHFNDGSELDAEFIGKDDFYGIGILKVIPEGSLKPVEMLKELYSEEDNNYPYDRGDAVVAIGNSGGFSSTVTYGIVSAVRNLRNRNYVLLPSVIQADVVINSGNEGCPLFDDRGRMIAMHEHRGGGGSMQNTTFFMPAWLVGRVADEIIADKAAGDDIEVWHPWLGIKPFAGTAPGLGVGGGLRTFGDDLKMFMDIPDQYWDVGIAVDTVYPESPAREYGLLDKDILMALTVLDKHENEKKPYMLLKSIETLELLATTAAEGDLFVFKVLRNHKMFDVEIVIGQHPGAFRFISGSNMGIERSQDYF